MKLIKFVDKFFPKFIVKYLNGLDSEKLCNYLGSNPSFIIPKLDSEVLFDALSYDYGFVITKLDDDSINAIITSFEEYKLIDLIMCLNSSSRKRLLSNKTLKIKLFDSKIHYFFSYLSDDEFALLFDKNYFLSFLNKQLDSRDFTFLCVFLGSNCVNTKNRLLADNKVLDFLNDNYSIIKNYKITNLNYDFGQYLIDYCFSKKDATLLPIIRNVSLDKLVLLLKGNYDKILSLKPDCKFLFSLPQDGINELIRYNYFFDIYMNNLGYVASLVLDGYTIPSFLENNSNIIDYFSHIDLRQYLKYYNALCKNNINIALVVDKKKKRELQFNNNSLIDLIFLYFKDTPKNFLNNLYNMIRYIVSNNVSIIPKERISIYHNLLVYDSLSISEKKNFFLCFSSDIDYTSYFYDDYRNVRNLAYTDIKNNLLSKDNFKSLKKTKDSGVDVYHLRGEPFTSMVHCTNNVLDWKFHDTICFSLIGNQNIAVFNDNMVICGFDNIDINNIIHTFNSDSYSSRLASSSCIQSIYNSKELLDNSVGYNEILYKEVQMINPDYIVCFDKVNNMSLSASKKFNVPILLIHSKFYTKKSGCLHSDSHYEDDNDFNFYFESDNLISCDLDVINKLEEKIR